MSSRRPRPYRSRLGRYLGTTVAVILACLVLIFLLMLVPVTRAVMVGMGRSVGGFLLCLTAALLGLVAVAVLLVIPDEEMPWASARAVSAVMRGSAALALFVLAAVIFIQGRGMLEPRPEPVTAPTTTPTPVARVTPSPTPPSTSASGPVVPTTAGAPTSPGRASSTASPAGPARTLEPAVPVEPTSRVEADTPPRPAVARTGITYTR